LQLYIAATVSLAGRIFASRLRCRLPVASLRRGYGVAAFHLRPLTQNAPFIPPEAAYAKRSLHST